MVVAPLSACPRGGDLSSTSESHSDLHSTSSTEAASPCGTTIKGCERRHGSRAAATQTATDDKDNRARTRLTRKRSLVQTQYRPPKDYRLYVRDHVEAHWFGALLAGGLLISSHQTAVSGEIRKPPLTVCDSSMTI